MTTNSSKRVSLDPQNELAGPLLVPVEAGPHHYDIVVGDGLLPSLGELARAAGAGPGLLVSDDTVARLYAEQCLGSLRSAGCQVQLATVPAGEASKTLVSAERLYGACLSASLDRGATIYALGGGVVGDLAGFVAGTFMRGVRFVQVPTTLLAQVDASVGGKTAVDLPQAKNAVGVFHQPSLVLADVGTLASLPDREFRAGLAEVVKHAAIADARMFDYLREQATAILSRDLSVLTRLVARNCQIKSEVVQADPQEAGWRAVLNYGHTLGHAIERAAGEWDLRHGEAVAFGMIAEAEASERLQLADSGVAGQLRSVLQALGLAQELPAMAFETARAALRHDKKLHAGRLRLPLVPRIGQAVLTEDVGLETLEQALETLFG